MEELVELKPLITVNSNNNNKLLSDSTRAHHSKKLRIANGFAAFFHFVFASMVCYIGAKGKAPYTIYFDTFWADFVIPPSVKTPFCCLEPPEECSEASAPGYGTLTSPTAQDCQCRVYVEGEFSEWIDCASLRSSDWKELNWDYDRLYTPLIKNVWAVKTWVVLFVFELLTFMMHAFLTAKHALYMWFVDRNLQPFRWLEYSVTSSLMIVAVASLSSITDIHLLLYMALVQSYVNSTGGWLFELLDFVQARFRMKSRMELVIKRTKWCFFFVAWIGFVLEFVTIFTAFYSVLNPYFDLESGYLWREIFFFVEIATWGLFVSYFAFPAIHLYQVSAPYLLKNKKLLQFKRLINKDYYYNAEFAYIIASFFAKGFLTTVIFYAAIARDEETN